MVEEISSEKGLTQMPTPETDITYIIQNLDSRIRSNESRFRLISERLEITNRNMLKGYRKITKETNDLNSELKEIKNDIQEIKVTLKRIIKEMELFARKDSLKILEKYINLWNPLNFVTQEELQEALKSKKRGVK